MIDIKFLRENPDAVKENIKKKFQDSKLPLVDEVIELDAQRRAAKQKADDLRANRNKISKEIGKLMAQGKREEGMALKDEVNRQAEELKELEAQEDALNEKVTEIMMKIPQIIDPSVPIGKDDSQNVEIGRSPQAERHRFRFRAQGSGQRLLLSDGRHRQTAQRRHLLRARLYD